MSYTIKELSKKTGISTHTLRFWAKSDLFPIVYRDENGVRHFSDADLGWVAVVHCLRETRLSIENIKEYIELCFKGDSTLERRLEIMVTQRQKIKDIICNLSKSFGWNRVQGEILRTGS